MITKKILVPQSQSSSPIMQYTILQVLFGPLHFNLVPGGSDGKASAYNVGDLGWIPGLGRSPGEGNGNPLQYSCLENPMDKGAWWATVHGVARARHNLATKFSRKHTLLIGFWIQPSLGIDSDG